MNLLAAQAPRRPILVATGLLPDGRDGIVDFQLAHGESAAERERLPVSLHRYGPTGEGFEMICADSGNGLSPLLCPLSIPTSPPGAAGPQGQERPQQTLEARPGGR